MFPSFSMTKVDDIRFLRIRSSSSRMFQINVMALGINFRLDYHKLSKPHAFSNINKKLMVRSQINPSLNEEIV